MIVKDWMTEAAEEIVQAHDIYGDITGCEPECREIIAKHSPFKDGITYIPVQDGITYIPVQDGITYIPVQDGITYIPVPDDDHGEIEERRCAMEDWTIKAADEIGKVIDSSDVAPTDARMTSIIAAHAEPLITQLTEQRAELTGTLSETFKAIPECYDTPADHYREMARRIVESRDTLKHQCRTLEGKLAEIRSEWESALSHEMSTSCVMS